MFAKIQCPYCKKKTSLGVYLLQIELKSRQIRCEHCAKAVATKFQHRVHITGYQLISLSALGGMLVGLALELPSAFRSYQQLDFIGGSLSVILSIVLFSVLFVVFLGLPLLYLGAPALQIYLDTAGRKGSAIDKSRNNKRRIVK